MQEALGNITMTGFPILYRSRMVGFTDWNFLMAPGHVPCAVCWKEPQEQSLKSETRTWLYTSARLQRETDPN